jgi:hypothetical protein
VKHNKNLKVTRNKKSANIIIFHSRDENGLLETKTTTTNKQTKQASKQANKQTKQANKQTSKQANKQTNKQAHKAMAYPSSGPVSWPACRHRPASQRHLADCGPLQTPPAHPVGGSAKPDGLRKGREKRIQKNRKV